MESLSQKQAQLAAMQVKVKEISDKVLALREKYTDNVNNKERLKNASEQLEVKLERQAAETAAFVLARLVTPSSPGGSHRLRAALHTPEGPLSHWARVQRLSCPSEAGRSRRFGPHSTTQADAALLTVFTLYMSEGLLRRPSSWWRGS